MSKHARPRGLPVDGVERPTADGWTFPARNPATGEALWDVPDAGLADARDAVTAARRAFDATQWSTDADLRADAVDVSPPLVAEHADELVDADGGRDRGAGRAAVGPPRRRPRPMRPDVRTSEPQRGPAGVTAVSRPPPRPCRSPSRRSVACSSTAAPSC